MSPGVVAVGTAEISKQYENIVDFDQKKDMNVDCARFSTLDEWQFS